MNLTTRTGAAMAVAVVAGATVLANPVHAEQTVSPAISSAAVDLTAASTELKPWPPLPTPTGSASAVATAPVTSTALRAKDLASVADQIDESYIDFRYGARTDFTAFANRLGYLGKQLYIGYNLIESIVASDVFNGTDIARGEGLLRNIGDIAGDVLLSTLFVAIDEISLASPDTYPIAIARPPTDHPGEWGDALAPNRYDPLSVPPRYSTTRQAATDTTTAAPEAAAAADGSTPIADAIDNAFIDGTVLFRTGVTPALNLLGFVGKQIYVGLNFTESILASAVFNTTNALRGEGIPRSLAIFASDIGRSALFVAIDEVSIGQDLTPIAISRAPQNPPSRWSDALPPAADVPLTVPDRSRDSLTAKAATAESTTATTTGTTSTNEESAPARSTAADGPASADAPKPTLLSTWKDKSAERAAARAEKAEQAKAARVEKREQAKAAKSDKAGAGDAKVSTPAASHESGSTDTK